MNRILIRISALSFVSLAIFGITACGVDDPTTQDAAVLEDVGVQGVSVDARGVLHFDSPKAFFDAIDQVARIPLTELDAWEQSHGFLSQRRMYGQIMTQVAQAGSLEAAAEILRIHEDIIEVKGDDARLRIPAHGYTALVGRDGFFYVDGTLHKVLPEVVITAQDGRYETIESVISSLGALGTAPLRQLTKPREGVQIMRYDGVSAMDPALLVNSGCTDYKSALKFNSDEDRRADIEMKTWPYGCSDCCGNSYVQVKVDGWVRGAKKNIFGNWDFNYNTVYDWKNVEFEMTAPKGIPGYGDNVSYWQFNYASYTRSITSGSTGGEQKGWFRFASWNVGDQIKNSSIEAPYFNKVKGQGKSRGTGSDGWAEICCGYAGGCNFSPPVCRTSCYVGECGYVSNNCGGTLYCGTCGGGGGCVVSEDGTESLIEGCGPSAL